MVARFATSPPVNDPEIEAKRRQNLQERLKPSLMRAAGFRGGIWLKAPDGLVHSITVWDSEESMRRAGEAANAQPRLPGHRPEEMPGPGSGQTVEMHEVLDFAFPETAHG